MPMAAQQDHDAVRRPLLWGELSWQDIGALVESGINCAILPIGSTEQHGPHLPTAVDTLLATAVAERVSATLGVPLLPELPYGCSLGHSIKWPGTLSLLPQTLAAVVAEIAAWVQAAGFRQLLLLNGHVTNWAPLRSALEIIRHTQPDLRVALRSLWDVSPRVHAWYCQDAANFHANCAETSMMLALEPELVRMDRAIDEPDRAEQCFFSYRMDLETLHGVVGRPSAATREFGLALIEACAADLTEQLGRAMTERIPLEQYVPPTCEQ